MLYSKADMYIKSGYLKQDKVFGHKTITWFAEIEAGGATAVAAMKEHKE